MRAPRRRARLPVYLLVGVIAGALAFVTAVQVRSQAEVERSLAGQDPTSLAFLIDDLHTSNDTLSIEISRLEVQRDALRGSGGRAQGALKSEIGQLELADGLTPVRGPGVIISVDARLKALDLQDALNNLRISGAEAISVNGRRIVTGTPITDAGGPVVIGDQVEQAPWTIVVIGDSEQLASAADLMTRSLKAQPGVTVATWRAVPDVRIAAVVPFRPLIYGTPG